MFHVKHFCRLFAGKSFALADIRRLCGELPANIERSAAGFRPRPILFSGGQPPLTPRRVGGGSPTRLPSAVIEKLRGLTAGVYTPRVG